MTTQERETLKMLWGRFQLPHTSFFKQSLDSYIAKRERTTQGFIGFQVPYEVKGTTHWSDFSVYIPKQLDFRIECKTLNKKSIGLINSVFGEMVKMKSNIIEQDMVFYLKGNGFDNNIIDSLASEYEIKIVRSLHEVF